MFFITKNHHLTPYLLCLAISTLGFFLSIQTLSAQAPEGIPRDYTPTDWSSWSTWVMYVVLPVIIIAVLGYTRWFSRNGKNKNKQ